eukprot:scaffold63590_cov36-Tisochrysis_lutea.AAC.2
MSAQELDAAFREAVTADGAHGGWQINNDERVKYVGKLEVKKGDETLKVRGAGGGKRWVRLGRRSAARTPRGKNRGHAGLVVSAAAALRAARCTAAGDGAARRRIKRQLSWITTCVPSGDV